MSAIRLRGVRKHYGATEVIRGVDLEVRDGEFLVFVGPSGCGKSTLLRMIAGLEDISAGELLIDGVRANAQRPAERGAAMVFQSYALYPHLTVADNMGFSLRMAGVRRAQREAQVRAVAESLKLSELLQRYPRELSGGQRQRVAIGRAIVRRPKVFLFDEPLSNLDAALRVDMRIELARLHAELRTTMIYVTHDQVEAMTLGDRIAVFDRGRIEQLGAPLDLYQRPADAFVAGFLGTPRINFIERPAQGAPAPLQALWQAMLPSAPARAARAGLRPEHLHVALEGPGVPAQVALVEHLGDSAIVHLRLAGTGEVLHARSARPDLVVGPGQPVWLGVEPGAALAFDDQGRTIAP